MVDRKPLVRVGGKSKQLPDGDKLHVEALPVGTTAGTVAAGDDPRFDGGGGVGNLDGGSSSTTFGPGDIVIDCGESI